MIEPAPKAPDTTYLSKDRIRAIADAWEEACALDATARLALSDPRAALDILNGVKETGSFSFLRVAAISLIAKGISAAPREADIRRQFYGDLPRYLPSAVISKVRTIGRNVPDGFVVWRNRECPVEIKRAVFDQKALAQLQRYLIAYDAEIGIAVAPELGCVLPTNVHFVEVR